MKKIILIVVILAALGAGGYFAYVRYVLTLSPRERFEQMVAAAAVGDEKLFLDGFTSESSRLIGAFLALSRSYEQVSDAPYRNLVAARVSGETVRGDRATVVTELGRRTLEVPMVREDGVWKVDGFALEEALK